MFTHLIHRLVENPKSLFIIDGLGALLSSFLLGVLLVHWQPIFGIPTATLYFLAAIPVGFAVFDAFAFCMAQENTTRLLRIIASLNLTYCLLSLALATQHATSITLWGWAYLGGEIMVVLVLAFLELRVAKSLQKTI